MNTFEQNLNSALVAKMIPAEGDAFVTMHPRALEQARAFNDKIQALYGGKQLTGEQEIGILAGAAYSPNVYGEVVDGVVQPMDEAVFELTMIGIEKPDAFGPVVAGIVKAIVGILGTTDKLKI